MKNTVSSTEIFVNVISMLYIIKARHYKNQEKIFEGPLDLLLELIEKEKLDITDISLSLIADQFLEYLENADVINLENLVNFLLVAAKLILIKSKTILPMLELKKEEEEDIENLKTRLKEYKKFREISREIERLEKKRKIFFPRQCYLGMKTAFWCPRNITATDLRNSFYSIVERLPKKEVISKNAMKDSISIKDKIENIKQVLSRRMEITFKEISYKTKNKIELIVIFLALLELTRKKTIVIEQTETFGDIRIMRRI